MGSVIAISDRERTIDAGSGRCGGAGRRANGAAAEAGIGGREACLGDHLPHPDHRVRFLHAGIQDGDDLVGPGYARGPEIVAVEKRHALIEQGRSRQILLNGGDGGIREESSELSWRHRHGDIGEEIELLDVGAGDVPSDGAADDRLLDCAKVSGLGRRPRD